MKKDEIPENFQEIIDMQLIRNEDVLWVGVPEPLVLLKRRIISSLPFSLIFVGVIIFMFVVITQMTGGFGRTQFGNQSSPMGFFSIFRYLFIAVLAFMVIGPVWGYIKQTRSVYVVTNQRVFMILRGFTTDIQSYGPQNIEFVKVRYYDGGYGDVIFDREMHSYRDYDQEWGNHRTRTKIIEIGFFAIQDPAQVEALLLENFVNQSDEVKSKRKNSHWD